MDFTVDFRHKDEHGKYQPIYQPQQIGIELLDKIREIDPSINISDLNSKIPQFDTVFADPIEIPESTARESGHFHKTNSIMVNITSVDLYRQHLELHLNDSGDVDPIIEDELGEVELPLPPRYQARYRLKNTIINAWRSAGFPTQWK